MKIQQQVAAQQVQNSNTDKDDASKRLLKLKKTCSDFESVFIQSLVKTMRKTVIKSGLLPESPGTETYKSMFDQQLSTFLSKGQGMGLGQAMFNQMVGREGLEDVADEHDDSSGVFYTKTISSDRLADQWRLNHETEINLVKQTGKK
jgi:flagellar protein FlgJ